MLTIGQMSKVCGVTVKTLRHYDKIGLLKAMNVDEFTGYRYYSEEQIKTMLLISRLKRYGFALADIQNLLKFPDSKEMQRQLRFQIARLEQERESLSMTIRDIVGHLEEFERTGNIMSYQYQYQIVLKESEPLALLTERQRMSVDEFGDYYGKIYQRIVKDRLKSSCLSLAIYYDEEFDPADGDVELGVEILEKDKADKVLPSVLCATTIHRGGYSSLPEAYGKVAAWIQENGYRIVGAPYEIYRKNAFNKLPTEEWETEIYFPVEK